MLTNWPSFIKAATTRARSSLLERNAEKSQDMKAGVTTNSLFDVEISKRESSNIT